MRGFRRVTVDDFRQGTNFGVLDNGHKGKLNPNMGYTAVRWVFQRGHIRGPSALNLSSWAHAKIAIVPNIQSFVHPKTQFVPNIQSSGHTHFWDSI